MESNMEVPQNIKNKSAMWSSNSTSGYIPKGNDNRILRDLKLSHIYCSIITTAKTWKQAMRLSKDPWVKKMWGVHMSICGFLRLIMICLAWSFRGSARLSLSDNIQILSLRGSDWARALLEPYTYLYAYTHLHTLGYYSVRRKMSAICNNMDEPCRRYVHWGKSERKINTVRYHIYVKFLKAKLIKTESEMVNTIGWRVGELGRRCLRV